MTRSMGSVSRGSFRVSSARAAPRLRTVAAARASVMIFIFGLHSLIGRIDHAIRCFALKCFAEAFHRGEIRTMPRSSCRSVIAKRLGDRAIANRAGHEGAQKQDQ